MAAGESSLQTSPPGNLKQLLIECAKAVAENNMVYFEKLVDKARGEVSITGEPIQRLGAYLVEGLVARNQSSGSNIYRALNCREPESKDLLSYMQILYEICPYLKFGYILPLQLHHMPDESVDVNNPRDGLLRMIKSLNPKVTTLVEQESNTNTTPFLTRFVETLEYYLAIFESIDVTLSRDRKERIGLEQHCLARDMVNVVACEGRERVERHEMFGKWKSRFTMAGFKQYPLSSYVNSVIKSLLKCYSEHYTLVEKDGAMLLGWKERNLISASAWY
ncbi:Chitin-inducible gibberellin-responsive protein 1 [Linum grandiflorum]